MTSPLAVTNIGQLVTVAGPPRARIREEMRDLGIVHDAAFLVEDGRISKLGTRAALERLITPRHTVVDAGGRVVLPGFVDAHTHPVFAGNRAAEFERRCAGATYQEIAAEGGGIRSTVRLTRAASEDVLLAAAARHQQWFLRGGTTTIEAKSGYGLSTEDELKLLRVIRRLAQSGPLRIVPTFLGAHDVPDEYRQRREGYVRLVIEEMLPRVADLGLARQADVFCEDGAFSVAESRAILGAARRHGLSLRVHADQLALTGGAQLAAELGAATADHLEHIDSAGIEALARAGVQPVLLPASVYALRSSKYPPARAMIDAGLAVVLATDFNPGSSPTTSMPMAISLAATQMRLTSAEAIAAATINAAASLGMAQAIGSLEEGKAADFVVHDADDYREIGYFFAVPAIHSTWIAGRRAA